LRFFSCGVSPVSCLSSDSSCNSGNFTGGLRTLLGILSFLYSDACIKFCIDYSFLSCLHFLGLLDCNSCT
jgi:hypothetical protein